MINDYRNPSETRKNGLHTPHMAQENALQLTLRVTLAWRKRV